MVYVYIITASNRIPRVWKLLFSCSLLILSIIYICFICDLIYDQIYCLIEAEILKMLILFVSRIMSENSLRPSNDRKSFRMFKRPKISSNKEEHSLTESVDEKHSESKSISLKSPKFKTKSLKKLFKRADKKKSREVTEGVYHVTEHPASEGQISFSNIMCSTPLINTAPPDDVTPDPPSNGDHDTEESGIFSPSFLGQPYTPPSGFKPPPPPTEPAEPAPEAALSTDQLFSKLKVPTIELTVSEGVQGAGGGSRSSLESGKGLVTAETKSVSSFQEVRVRVAIVTCLVSSIQALVRWLIVPRN